MQIGATTLSPEEYSEILDKAHDVYEETGEFPNLDTIDDDNYADAYEIAHFKDHTDLHEWFSDMFTYDEECPKKFKEGDLDYTGYQEDFNGVRYYITEDTFKELTDFIKNHRQYSLEKNISGKITKSHTSYHDWEISKEMLEDIRIALDSGYYVYYVSNW